MADSLAPGAWILSEGRTASTDYFLFPYLASLGYQPALLDSRSKSPPPQLLTDCRLLVVSRYLPRRWFRMVQSLRRSGTRLVYFMDDDLFDVRALRGLPRHYQWKILSQALILQAWWPRLCGELWVSTGYLAEKYAKFHPRLLQPMASAWTAHSGKGIHVCYHGTASHAREVEWLAPIIDAVQSQSDNVHFELFDTPAARRLIRELPRVSLLCPMAWPNYLAFTSVQNRDIALAPLLPGAFNAARGPTKFYDYTRMGAVGVYSDLRPYRGFIRDGVDGVLLKNDPAAWAAVLLQLAEDGDRRAAMVAEARRRVLQASTSR